MAVNNEIQFVVFKGDVLSIKNEAEGSVVATWNLRACNNLEMKQTRYHSVLSFFQSSNQVTLGVPFPDEKFKGRQLVREMVASFLKGRIEQMKNNKQKVVIQEQGCKFLAKFGDVLGEILEFLLLFLIFRSLVTWNR